MLAFNVEQFYYTIYNSTLNTQKQIVKKQIDKKTVYKKKSKDKIRPIKLCEQYKIGLRRDEITQRPTVNATIVGSIPNRAKDLL